MLKFFPEEKQVHLLDLATGTADQLICLLENQENIIKAIGLDLADQMMHIGKKKMEEKHYRHKISFIQADAQKLPFEKNSFECVTMSFGIRNIEDPSTCLQEIFRVLKTNGRCLILEMSIPENLFWKKIYLFHLRKVLPFLGDVIAKNKKAYHYLNQTTETFAYGKKFLCMLKMAGFKKVIAHPLTFGAVTLYVADKK